MLTWLLGSLLQGRSPDLPPAPKCTRLQPEGPLRPFTPLLIKDPRWLS